MSHIVMPPKLAKSFPNGLAFSGKSSQGIFAWGLYLYRRPGGWLSISALALALDYLTGPHIQFPIVFSLPVLFASWHRGWRWGICLALVLPVFRFGIALVEGAPGTPAILALNMLIRMAVLCMLALLVARTARQLELEIILEKNRKEIQAAGKIQEKLFPSQVPNVDGFDIAGACYPANPAGGDYFDFIPMPDKQLAIAVGDVSGHGFGPALLMAEVHAYLKALALKEENPGLILTLANRLFFQDSKEEFVTLFFALLDPSRRSFYYASAGQEAHLLDVTGKLQKLPCTGLPLGIEENEIIPCAPLLTLESGQIVLLLTDGVLETRSLFGAPFGLERTREVVWAHRTHTARQIIEALWKAVTQHGSPFDDLTVVVIKMLGP